jgi:hypothetical protein
MPPDYASAPRKPRRWSREKFWYLAMGMIATVFVALLLFLVYLLIRAIGADPTTGMGSF